MSRLLLSGADSLNRHMAAVCGVIGISPVKSSCVDKIDLTAKLAHLHLLMACILNSVNVAPTVDI